jgi:hypothetical protein
MIYTAPYVRSAFDADKSITRASGRGLGPGNRDFLGPVKWRVPFGAQKGHTERNAPVRKIKYLPQKHS